MHLQFKTHSLLIDNHCEKKGRKSNGKLVVYQFRLLDLPWLRCYLVTDILISYSRIDFIQILCWFCRNVSRKIQMNVCASKITIRIAIPHLNRWIHLKILNYLFPISILFCFSFMFATLFSGCQSRKVDKCYSIPLFTLEGKIFQMLQNAFSFIGTTRGYRIQNIGHSRVQNIRYRH